MQIEDIEAMPTFNPDVDKSILNLCTPEQRLLLEQSSVARQQREWIAARVVVAYNLAADHDRFLSKIRSPLSLLWAAGLFAGGAVLTSVLSAKIAVWFK